MAEGQVIRRMEEHWRQQGLPRWSGARTGDVEALASACGVALPPSFKDFLLTAAGSGVDDAHGYAFWPISDVKTVAAEVDEVGESPSLKFSDNDRYYLFADYFDWSWAYAIRLDDSPKSGSIFLIGKAEAPIEVAETFERFVDLYRSDSDALHGPVAS
jgi:hypothetical protein